MGDRNHEKSLQEPLILSEPALYHKNCRVGKHRTGSLRSTLITVSLTLLIGSAATLLFIHNSCLLSKDCHFEIFNCKSCDPDLVTLRHNCWPQSDNVSLKECTAKGCCWDQTEAKSGVPRCFYPTGYQLYTVESLSKSGSQYLIKLLQMSQSGWPNDIKHVAVTVTMETPYRLRIKVFDPQNARYEVPLVVSNKPNPQYEIDTEIDTFYDIDVPRSGPFYISVTRKSTGQVLFSAKDAAPLIFSDQFIQVGTKLSTSYLYGLGEHMDDFVLNTSWTKKVLWTRDLPPSPDAQAKDVNLYGVHPFYLNIESDNNAHGVFLLNSNAMEIEIQPSPELTYRTIGGILDFYIFTGPSPINVVEQYIELIGRPFMPPYWSLGFHLSRHGYGGTKILKKVIKRNRDAKMYYDSQWVDSDAMRSQLDWTYDSKGIWKGLLDVVKDLHDHGQHFNMLVDPFISVNQTPGTYSPYFDGLASNVFIKTPNETSNLVGLGWPGHVVYIDFTNPNTSSYWMRHAKTFHDLVPYDGHLIDMNEPSNFVNGSIEGCPNNTLENPPFVPTGIKQGILRAESVCVSARQYLSTHYNVHSLYGHSQSIVAKMTLDTVIGKRSFAITRSSYAGTGVHAGHWSGDCNSEWGQLSKSISGMLSFQLFGIPFWGVDICGFAKNTTPEMCARWFQLGVFYPFMWNHNEIGAKDQDPGVFDAHHQNIIRKALELRYYLLPYLYTMLYGYHIHGRPFIMPLFFLYPESANNVTYTINKQFMWGSGLLVTPALHQGITETQGYLPKDRWYDFYTHLYVDSPGQFMTFDLPLDNVNVQIRGGAIIPMQTPKVTTTLSRKEKFILYVALSAEGGAHGDLMWDDGVSLDSYSGGKYNFIKFQVTNNTLTSTNAHLGYTDEPMVLGHITVMGVESEPIKVEIDGEMVESFSYDRKVLQLSDLTVNMQQPFQVLWK